MKRIKYFTAEELAAETLKAAKADERWEDEFKKKGVYNLALDYCLPTTDKECLKKCSFDVMCNVCYGTSEGIYASIYALGRTDDSKELKRVDLITLKTLDTDYKSYMELSILGAHIAYHANEIVIENLNRFD